MGFEVYKDMTEILQDDFCGEYRISHFTIDRNTFEGIRAILRLGIPEGSYVRLTRGYECIMSETPMEKRSNLKFVNKAHGRVLVAGLGIGMILLAIQDKPEVEEIIVVEMSQEVIDLVQPQLPLNNKVKIVHEDIFEYIPEGKFNTIYFDIWATYNSDTYEDEMVPLMDQYITHLVSDKEDPNRYIDCWAKDAARYNRELI